MSPEEEKAIDLVEKFSPYAYWADGMNQNLEYSKRCALIAIEEILDINDTVWVGTDDRGGLESSIDF